MSKVSATYHLVFGTKCRKPTIPVEMRRELYKMIFYYLKSNGCFVHRIGGTSNHVHILFDLHPTKALSTIVSTVKVQTSAWMSKEARFPYFDGWCREYYAACVMPDTVESVAGYIANQDMHHGMLSYEDEMVDFFRHNHWKFLPSYLD